MPVGYLYVTENLVDGTCYIGQSSRLDEHSVATYLGSGDFFQQALAEHGAENFQKTVLGYFDDQGELDYTEVWTIANFRAEGDPLYNGGVGGPRAHRQFVREMFERFGVLPQMPAAWFDAVTSNPADVKDMLALGAETDSDAFYQEYEAQLRQTQNLTGECPSCGAVAGDVCRTKTGNPAKNHAKRGRAA